jgi:hypothetical protein
LLAELVPGRKGGSCCGHRLKVLGLDVRYRTCRVAGRALDPHYVDILVKNLDKAAEINERWPD